MSSRWLEIRTWRTSRQGVVGRELQQQALAEVAGPDARRVELLDQAQGLLGLREGDVAAEVADDLVELEVQEPVVVEVVDDVLGQGADGRLGVEEAELVGQVVVERLRPRGHVLHGVVLAVGLLAQRGPAEAVRLAERARTSRPVPSNSGRLGGLVAVVGGLRRPRPPAPGTRARSTRTGFSLSSWSIRSCKAMSGSCRISIDWIMRGAMRSRMSVRICCEVSRRMVLDSAAREGDGVDGDESEPDRPRVESHERMRRDGIPSDRQESMPRSSIALPSGDD